jgi:hypothetical protein
MSDYLLSAFRTALREMPGSIRALAREAGLSDALLIRVRDGERGLTRETVRAVAAALRGWGDRCHALAEALEQDDGPPEQGGTDA